MAGEFQVAGQNEAALFTLKLHRGDGMCLLAMNWKKGKPPKDFVGFAIEYKQPDGLEQVGTEGDRCPDRILSAIEAERGLERDRRRHR